MVLHSNLNLVTTFWPASLCTPGWPGDIPGKFLPESHMRIVIYWMQKTRWAQKINSAKLVYAKDFSGTFPPGYRTELTSTRNVAGVVTGNFVEFFYFESKKGFYLLNVLFRRVAWTWTWSPFSSRPDSAHSGYPRAFLVNFCWSPTCASLFIGCQRQDERKKSILPSLWKGFFRDISARVPHRVDIHQ